MKVFIFPGQGSQFPGMAKNLYEQYPEAYKQMNEANEILGFKLTDIMFNGTEEDLKETKVTQPAIFLHSVVMASLLGNNFNPDAAAGHSLGEFSALVSCGTMSFHDGLILVSKRAEAMQKACKKSPSGMAAIIGLDDEVVEKICNEITDEIVVPANYNTPGQLVISGTNKGIEIAVEKLKQAGAKLAIILNVGGAFHSPLMEPAKLELETAINATVFSPPICPIYQNVNALPEANPEKIKQNLISQLTSPVRWTQTIQNMIIANGKTFIETGPGSVLQKMVKKIDRTVESLIAETLISQQD